MVSSNDYICITKYIFIWQRNGWRPKLFTKTRSKNERKELVELRRLIRENCNVMKVAIEGLSENIHEVKLCFLTDRLLAKPEFVKSFRQKTEHLKYKFLLERVSTYCDSKSVWEKNHVT